MSNINQDVQASHKILSLLEKANAHSEDIIDHLPGIFLVVNEKFEILRANLETASLFHLEYEDLLRTRFSDLFKFEVWEIFERRVKELEATPELHSLKFELGMYDKGEVLTEKPFYWHISKMDDHNGAEGQIYIIKGEDISQLRESESRLLNIFASIPLGILTIDENGNIEDTYSSYLSCLLGENDLNGKQFKKAVFGQVESELTRDELKGIDNIYESLNAEEQRFEELEHSFPKHIFIKSGNDEGKHLQISYKPVSYEGLVKRLLIILEDRTKIVNAEREREKARMIEQQSRAVIENAMRDPLTGLYTRLCFDDAVEEMLENHSKKRIPSASLIMFDVDHFKAVNDTYGHDAGDRVLKEIARIILDQVRETDIPVRFGGEEFMVFLPQSCDKGYLLAERIRTSIEKTPMDIGDGRELNVTISGGIACHREGETLNQLVKRADQLLYQAKEAGRNQSVKE